MKLSSYLDTNLIFVNLESKEKDDIISEMIEKASKQDESIYKNIDIIKKSVLKREHEISTAMGGNIAIPHARIEAYDDVTVVIGFPKDGLVCETAIRTKDCVNAFFMIIAGQVKNKLMLKLMSSIIKLASKKDIFHSILTSKDPEKVKLAIDQANIEVTERIIAEDIMNQDIEPTKLDATIEEIAKRFTIEQMRGIPVVDDFGNFIGEITERELIEYGMPKYTSLMNDLSFMTVGEPFEEYFKNEKSVTVKDLYRKKPTIVDREASIMEVSFLMITKGNTRVYVVEDQKYYGMITRSDIIRKVLHI